MAFRDGPFHDLKFPFCWVAGAATLACLVVALVFLVLDRPASASALAPVRNGFSRAVAPVGGVLETPVEWGAAAVQYVEGYFFAVAENRRLKQQVRELEGWRDTAIALKNVNDRYEALLKLKTDPVAPMVSARAITDSRGPFAQARLLNAGAASGVTVGDPVLSEHGVVGRVVGVAPNVSRMLLLTDVESRTPVLVDRTNARAILTGDGGPYPRLEYVRGRDPIRDGDMILTSGDGGVFPRGLPVGVAARDLQGTWRVRLYSDQTPIDYVRLLLYQDFGREVAPGDLSSGALPPLTATEQAQRAAALAKATTPKTGSASASAPQAVPAAKPSGKAKSSDRSAKATPAPAAASPAAEPAPAEPVGEGAASQ